MPQVEMTIIAKYKPIPRISKRHEPLHFCFILFTILACVLLLPLPTGAVETSLNENTDLSVWVVPEAKWKQELPNRLVYEDFVRQHPNIKVRQAGGMRIEDPDNPAAQSTFLMAMAGNTAPDVVQVSDRDLATYVTQGFLRPLDEYVLAPENKEWFESAFPTKFRKTLKYNGHYYVIPYNFVLAGLYYRRDRFRDVGLSPDRGPRDWEEMYDYARRLTFPEKGLYGYGVLTGPHNTPYYYPLFIHLAGGELVVECRVCPEGGEIIEAAPGTTQSGHSKFADQCPTHQVSLAGAEVTWQVGFHKDPAIKAFNFYKKMRWSRWIRCPRHGDPVDVRSVDLDTGNFIHHEKPQCPEGHHITPETITQLDAERKVYTGVITMSSYYHMNEKLERGEVAMLLNITSEWVMGSQNFVPATLFGYASLPVGPGGTPYTRIIVHCTGINSQVTDKATRDAAFQYMKHLASPNARRIKVQFHVENGYGELVDPEQLRAFGYEDYIDDAPPVWLKTYRELTQAARPALPVPGFKSVRPELAAPIDALLYARPSQIEKANTSEYIKACADRCNTILLGTEDPVQMMQKRKTARHVALIFVAVAAIAGLWWWRSPKQRRQRARAAVIEMPNPSPRRQFQAWMLMLPALGLLALWQYYPLGRVAMMAFQDYRILGDNRFVGLDNFINLVGSDIFWSSFWRTLQYVFLTLLLGFFTPIILAVFLQEVPRGKMFFRVVFYLPAVTSVIVLMFLWKRLYDPSATGALNRLFMDLGLIQEPQGWLNDPNLAMLCVITSAVWAAAGPGSIIYLAALKSVPEDIYESADLDGASPLRKMLSISLPYLKPLIIINFVGAFIGAFRATENIFVMTGGGPAYATHVLGLEIYYNAFMFLKFGYASAVSWALAALLIGFAIWQLRILKKVQFKTAES